MLVPGYLLATTVEHQMSFAELDVGALQQIDRWLAHVTQSLSSRFGRYLAFEHGSCEDASAGACIDHAHIHLVPLAADIGDILLEALKWRELRSYADLREYRGRPYVYLGIDRRHFVVDDPGLESQWLRREIAKYLGHDLWDWAIDDGIDALTTTLARLCNFSVET